MKKIFLILVLLIFVFGGFAQNVGSEINSKNINKLLLLKKKENTLSGSNKVKFNNSKQANFVQLTNNEDNKIQSYSQLRSWVLSENFENLTVPLPDGWRTISTTDLTGTNTISTDYSTGSNTWGPINAGSFGEDGAQFIYEGDYSYAINYNAGLEGNPFNWLVTPEVTLPNEESFLYFNIWYANLASEGWYTNFYVQIYANNTWNTLLTWKGTEGAQANIYEKPVVLDLTDYLGQNVKFAFVYEYTDGFQVALDNIYVGNAPENDLAVSLSLDKNEPFIEGDRVLFEANVENIGSSTQSDVQVRFKLNGDETQVKTISTIKADEVKTVYFPWTVEKGNTNIMVIIDEDNNTENNKDVFEVNAIQKGQLYESFDGDIFPPMFWSTNVLNDHDWERGIGYNSYASALYYAMDSMGVAELISPKLDLTASNTDSISFYYKSYGMDGWPKQDTLEILISTDSGESWERIDFLGRSESFKRYSYSLESYTQTNEAYIKFVAYDNGGFDVLVDEVTGPMINPVKSDAGLTKFESEKLAKGGFLTEGLRDIKVELKNYGIENLTSATIELSILDDNYNSEKISFVWTGDISTGKTEIVNVGSFEFVADKGYIVEVYVTESNGSDDVYTENNRLKSSFLATYAGQLAEDFEGDFPPQGWKIINNGSPEAFYQEPYSTTPESFFCACTPFSATGVPNNDWIVTPKLAPTSSNNRLTFWAISFGDESLDVKISTSGNNVSDFDVHVGNILPGEQYEWYGYSVDLSAYVGQEVYVAFKNSDGTRGAIAIDDVMGPIKAGLGEDDIEIKEIIYPKGYTYVGEAVNVQVVVKNTGTKSSSARNLKFLVNNTEKETLEVGEILSGDAEIIDFEFIPEKFGLQTLEVKLTSDDDNNDNNSTKKDVIIATYDMLTEGFEGSKAPAGWNFGNWFAGSYKTAVEGSNIAVMAAPYGYTNQILSTPKVNIDGTYPTVYFYGHGINFINNSYYSIKLVYSEDGESWYSLQDSVTLTPEMEMYQFDISGISNGEYYLGFAATSTFNYEDYEGLVVIDYIFGPEVIKTRPITYIPADGESNVVKDAFISVEFDRDIDEIDLYGVTIEGSIDGLVEDVNAFISDDKRTIIISHAEFSDKAQRYRVTIPENSVMEIDGIYNNSRTGWSFITENTTGVDDIVTLENEFTVYPNPVNDRLFINARGFNNGYNATICGISGNVIVSKSINGEINDIDVSNLPTGVYIIRLNNGDKIANCKFIKK